MLALRCQPVAQVMMNLCLQTALQKLDAHSHGRFVKGCHKKRQTWRFQKQECFAEKPSAIVQSDLPKSCLQARILRNTPSGFRLLSISGRLTLRAGSSPPQKKIISGLKSILGSKSGTHTFARTPKTWRSLVSFSSSQHLAVLRPEGHC